MDLAVAPDVLTRAMRSGDWPTGAIWGSRFRHLHPMFDKFNIELLQTPDQLVSDTRFLADWALRPDNRDHLKLTIGSQFGDSELPILDVEKALVFGGGAGYGDDFWLVIDLRSRAEDPRVVGNQFSVKGCDWVQISPSFTDFCVELSRTISS